MTAGEYNVTQWGPLWRLEELPAEVRDSGTADSPAFAAAVGAWQKAHRLVADGMLGPKTIAAMRAAARIEGIDVSGWQPRIDWSAVAGAGIRFALVKASQGDTGLSRRYAAQVEGARAAGLRVGAYHFAVPDGPDAAIEAAWFSRAIRSPVPDLLPALDLEDAGALRRLGAGAVTAWAETFVRELAERIGAWPLLYSYRHYFARLRPAADSPLLHCPIWRAQTATPKPLPPWPRWSIWQYAARAGLPGIAGRVDRNVLGTGVTLEDLAWRWL